MFMFVNFNIPSKKNNHNQTVKGYKQLKKMEISLKIEYILSLSQC
jgi:hypothetical protein